MDTDQLVVFERVVREGSFSRAAWALDLSQPTVSARVQALEAAVGGALFLRGGRGVTLTDLGASFLPYARRALEILGEGVDAARQVRSGQRGRVTIGALESLSEGFLGPALASFHAASPQVEVMVRAGRHEQLVQLLRDGVIGLALIAWPCPEALSSDLEVLLPLRERVILVAAPQHPLARRGPSSRQEVAALAKPLLLLRWWLSLPAPLAQLAQQASTLIDLPIYTGRQMALSGVGAGFFPWILVADALGDGRLAELAVPDMPPLGRESALVRIRRAAPPSAAASALVDALRQRAAQLQMLG